MSRSPKLKIQSFIALMLLVFVGQTIAMPLMNCCMESENSISKSDEMTGHHAMHETDMSVHHQSEMVVTKHVHTEQVNCNHQCDVCLGTVLLVNFTAFTLKTAPAQLSNTYHFYLPLQSSDNPFRPPIFA